MAAPIRIEGIKAVVCVEDPSVSDGASRSPLRGYSGAVEKPTTQVRLMSGEDAVRVSPAKDSSDLYDVYLLLTQAPDDLWRGIFRRQEFWATSEGGRVFVSVTSTPGDERPALVYSVADLDLAPRVLEAVKGFIERANQMRADLAEQEVQVGAEQIIVEAQRENTAAALREELLRRLPSSEGGSTGAA
jgi:hypothetical protein